MLCISQVIYSSKSVSSFDFHSLFMDELDVGSLGKSPTPAKYSEGVTLSIQMLSLPKASTEQPFQGTRNHNKVVRQYNQKYKIFL